MPEAEKTCKRLLGKRASDIKYLTANQITRARDHRKPVPVLTLVRTSDVKEYEGEVLRFRERCAC